MDRKVALIGNANVGKTTLFNKITGQRHRTGNWDGVTSVQSDFFPDIKKKFQIADTPGVFSLHESIADQSLYAWLLSSSVTHVVQVIDLRNLRKELCLTQQLLLLPIPLIIVIRNQQSIEGSQSVTKLLREKFKVLVYDESQVYHMHDWLDEADRISCRHNTENDQVLLQKEMQALHGVSVGKVNAELLALLERRYQLAEEIGAHAKLKENKSSRVEAWIIQPITGTLIFLGVMFSIFTLTVGVGGAFSEMFHTITESLLIAWPQSLLVHQPELLRVFVLGAMRGLQLSFDFISPLFILYFCLRAMEQSGYSARVALVMDRHFRRLGLSGRTFLPLLMGLGCNVPAIVATRILPRSEQMKAALMMPFMTCSARLTTFVAIIAVYFPVSGPWVLFFLYLLGFLVALLTAFWAKRSRMLGPNTPLVMQIPALNCRFKFSWLRDSLRQSWAFFRNITLLLIPGAVAIQCLLYYFSDNIAQLAPYVVMPFTVIGFTTEQFPASLGIFSGLLAKEMVIATMIAANKGQMLVTSQPVLGMAMLSEAWHAFQTALQHVATVIMHPSVGVMGEQFGFKLGGVFHSPKQALSFLVFIGLYFPCISTLGALSEVVGSRYMLYTAAWSIFVAYVFAIGVYWFFPYGALVALITLVYLLMPLLRDQIRAASLRLRDFFAGDGMV